MALGATPTLTLELELELELLVDDEELLLLPLELLFDLLPDLPPLPLEPEFPFEPDTELRA